MKILSTIFFVLALSVSTLFAQVYNDATLARVIQQDRVSRNSQGDLKTLTVGEHMYRADVYMSNRQFPQARAHWRKVLSTYPTDSKIPNALFGMGRSNMWERKYDVAVTWFDKLARDHANTLMGREGLAYKASSYVRLGESLKAAKTYEQYTVMFPYGKRIESSHLNIIDAYREIGEYDKANMWVAKTTSRFSGMKTATNALHGRLRMEVFRGNWNAVVTTADQLLRARNFSGSMAYEYEVVFLKALAFEKLGQKGRAIATYSSIPATPTSYFGGLATDKIAALGGNANYRRSSMKLQSRRMARKFPVLFRNELIRYSKSRGIDPRFVLSIMKQESNFRARAKSPAAARGLLQLTYDTALKYNKKAGFMNIKGTDLYRPSINIAIGSVYIKELKDEFGGLYEAIAASYNGGEDNAARWLKKTNPKDPAIFTSEVGFSETKKYVFKVMGNYNVYKELYTENLRRK